MYSNNCVEASRIANDSSNEVDNLIKHVMSNSDLNVDYRQEESTTLKR